MMEVRDGRRVAHMVGKVYTPEYSQIWFEFVFSVDDVV